MPETTTGFDRPRQPFINMTAATLDSAIGVPDQSHPYHHYALDGFNSL